jgi:RNA-directed DNA polymerase
LGGIPASESEPRRRRLQLKCDKELSDLSEMFNPVLRGWLNYYGRFYPSALKPLWQSVNAYLIRWLMRKYKRLARRGRRARRQLALLAQAMPKAFVHWEAGYRPVITMMGAG